MLQGLVMEYLSLLKEIHTLSTGSVNKIISVNQNGFYVETEASKSKFMVGEKKYPYDLIPLSHFLEVWRLLTEKRKIHAGDLKTSKGRSSFLMALFSRLPFVYVTLKAGRTAIGLKEYFVNELPEANINAVLGFLEEVAEGKFHPQTLTRQIEDKNLQRVKSSQRQGLRLLGFIDENFNVDNELIFNYRHSKEKTSILRNKIRELPYFLMVHELLSTPTNLNKIDKIKVIKDLGLLVIRNPIAGNLMKESVGDKLSRNTISWLQYVKLLDEELKGITTTTYEDEGMKKLKMLNKGTPGICYSNISLIKKALLQNSENILPYHEILLYVKKNWMNLNSTSEEINEIVDLALYAPKSYFHEVEDGLWGIKDKIDSRLNHIYQYMNPRKLPLKISDMKYRLKVYESDEMLGQLLLSDIRFSQIENSPYWVLSEWVIINNLVYDYLLNSELLGIEKEKAIERVIQKNKLDKEKVIFLPQFDDRFSVYGNKIELKLKVQISQDHNKKQELDIPVEINEEVGRLSYKIINYIKENKKEVTTSQIILHVFSVTANEPSFSIYSEAIKDLLEVIPEIKQVEDHKWKYSMDGSNLNIETNKNVYYAVRNSLPTIINGNELNTNASQTTNQMNKQEVSRNDIQTDSKMYAYHTVSYFDRVRGYFVIPKALTEKSVLFKQNYHGKVMVQHNDFRYEWFWEKKEDKFFFYGDGVMDFFADYLIEPGHKLRLEIDKQIMFLIRIHLVGYDERYASEQQRYLDIGRLVEESKFVNKSIFSLMCEALAIHPSGMHWSVLQDKISEKRSTTKNTVTNLLSRNECFEQVEGKKGYWRLNISKLSRYYINEENQEIMEPTHLGSDLWPDENSKSEIIKIEPEVDPHESNEKVEKVQEVDNSKITELQQLDTNILIEQIESTLFEITLEEIKFKDSISKKVQDNFTNGNIAAIEEIYKMVEPNIRFFNRVRETVNQQERKSEE